MDAEGNGFLRDLPKISISPPSGHVSPISNVHRQVVEMWCLVNHKIHCGLLCVQNAGQT